VLADQVKSLDWAIRLVSLKCKAPRAVLEEVTGESEAAAVPGVEEIHITGRLFDFIATWPEGSSYLGFIFACAESPERVEAALRQAHAALRFRITPRLSVAHPTGA